MSGTLALQVNMRCNFNITINSLYYELSESESSSESDSSESDSSSEDELSESDESSSNRDDASGLAKSSGHPSQH